MSGTAAKQRSRPDFVHTASLQRNEEKSTTFNHLYCTSDLFAAAGFVYNRPRAAFKDPLHRSSDFLVQVALMFRSDCDSGLTGSSCKLTAARLPFILPITTAINICCFKVSEWQRSSRINTCHLPRLPPRTRH